MLAPSVIIPILQMKETLHGANVRKSPAGDEEAITQRSQTAPTQGPTGAGLV